MKPFYGHSGSWIYEKVIHVLSLEAGLIKKSYCHFKRDWCK